MKTYVLVLYDGHKSHVSVPLIEWAKSNHIIFFVLPPHCSHLLQSLDVSCYGLFDEAWKSACHSHLRESGGNTVARNDVCKIASKVYAVALSPTNIQGAFKRCGIYPNNPSVIRYCPSLFVFQVSRSCRSLVHHLFLLIQPHSLNKLK